MNAECREFRPLLSAYMDNELTAAELRAVQAHVDTCAECADVLREYRQVRSAMRSLSQPVPPAELRAAVFAKATPAYRRRATVMTFGQRGLSYAAVAAAVIAIVFTGALLLRSGVNPGSVGAPDTTPPRIDSLNPLPEEDSWSLNNPIKIAFNEPMDHGSVEAALHITADPPLSDEERRILLATARWDGNTLIIGEGVVLKPYTDYTITIDANKARDRNQNALQTKTEYTFRTVDVVAVAPTPTVSVAIAVPSPTAAPSPTATLRPTESPIASTTNALPPPSASARPSDVPAASPSINPTPTTAVAVTSSPATATTPVQPTPTQTKTPPTPTPVTPTATPQPSSTPTETPPTPTVPAPTATTPPPTPTPSRAPYAIGESFAAIYPTLEDRLGLPTANATTVPGSYLAFEGGWMLWRGDTRTVYVLFNENPLVWYAFADSWLDGMDEGGGPAPKTGLYLPPRGFNKVWSENPDVQRRLGFALTPNETGGNIAIQPFERGLLLSSTLGAPTIYVFYQNNTFETYPR